MMAIDPVVRIRAACANDVPALGRLGALLVATHHDFDRTRFPPGPNTAGAYGQFLRRRLEAPDAIVLVAEAGGVVAGYAYAAVEGSDYMALRGPAGVLYDLIVEPQRRRQGLGRALMQAAVAELTTRKVPRIVLFTAERNADAQRLFAKCLFRKTMIEMTRDLQGDHLIA